MTEIGQLCDADWLIRRTVSVDVMGTDVCLSDCIEYGNEPGHRDVMQFPPSLARGIAAMLTRAAEVAERADARQRALPLERMAA